ncbi:MAG: dihydrofolate reductase family protein [Kofleriaceae bacterium]
MRNLILKMSMSLDGFVSGPNGELDWVFKTGDDESRAWSLGVVSRATAHVIGRKTWSDWCAFYPTAKIPFAPYMNNVEKVVFTRSAALAPGKPVPADADPVVAKSWTNPRVANGDLVEEITRLKSEQGGDILASAGIEFIQALVAADLIDEYHLAIHPVVLGSGGAIFAKAAPRDLVLVDSKRFPKGVVAHTYRKTHA